MSQLLFATGLASRVRRILRQPTRLRLRPRFSPYARRVLLYHGVTPTGSTRFNSRFISSVRLADDLRLLGAVPGLRFVSLAELASTPPDDPAPCVALTFDDGYRNIATHALPVLRAAGVPAAVFVTAVRAVNIAASPILWPDRLDLAARLMPGPLEIAGERFRQRGLGGWRREGDRMPLKQLCKMRDQAFREKVEAALPVESRLAAEPQLDDYWQLLDRDALAALAAEPLVTIGSHGVTHSNLSSLEPESAQNELTLSKHWLEVSTGGPIDLLAWPDGDYTPALLDEAAAAGYRLTAVVDYRSAADIADPRLIDRLGINPYISAKAQLRVIAAGGYGHERFQ